MMIINKLRCGGQWLLIFSLLFIFTLPAQAVIPDNIDYQGYLTDSGGSAINGTVNISFSLYNIDTGGIALWSDIQSVGVTNGLFTVKLGRVGNPFPMSLFDAPLWLGIDVASDGEMSPRTALSSAAFAHKADDADSVGGISAGSLVQSSDLFAHAGDAGAHHSKTDSFTELGDQAADAQIPATITRDSELTTHAGDDSAHHLRYTNGEAVTAMGTKLDSNPLHHDKRSDTQVFAAVTSLDGAGSTLDADQVDGLEASEIIDAAQDEVRTPISSLPFTINASGSYYVTANLDGSSGGIDITADNVTLDLMGFTLDGGGTVADYGIYFRGRSNITIKNGTVRGFGWAGIFQDIYDIRYATVMDIKALNNGSLGTTDSHSGILLYSSHSHVERCIAGSNGGSGIYAWDSSKLINNTAYGNTGNNAIYGGYIAILYNNTAYNNTVIVTIHGGSGANLRNNTARNNNSTYAIYGGHGSTLSGNTASANDHWGIFGAGSNTIQDNTIYYNNTSDTAGQGGLSVSSDSQVIGNTLDKNFQNNIYVGGSDNAIENNLVTDSTNGIFFNANGNFYANNRASGNTTNYNLGATSQTDGGGNWSF